MKLKSKRIRNRRNPSHDEGSRLRRPSRVRRKPKKAEETGEEESSVAPQRRRVRRPVRSPASAAKKRGASRIRGKKKEKKEEEEETFGGASPQTIAGINRFRQERKEEARIRRQIDRAAAPADFEPFRKQREPVDPGKGATPAQRAKYEASRGRFLAKERGEKMDISKLPIPAQVTIWEKMKKMDASKLRKEEWDAIYKAGITTKEGQLLPFIKKRYQKL
jgi:hypothetical protein